MFFNRISICSLFEVFLSQSVVRHGVGMDFEEVNDAVNDDEEYSRGG